MSKSRAIIFDLDGTLWDATKGITAAWQQVLRGEGIGVTLTREAVMGCMGLPMDEIFLRLLPNIGDDARTEIQQKCQQYENEYLSLHGGTLYPNVERTLDLLKNSGYDLYIVTNSQDGYVEAFLGSMNLEKYFTDYEMFGRTGLLKAENIRLVMARNGIDNAVYVGDAQGDYDSAKTARIPFIYAKYGFGTVADFKYSVDKFDELQSAVCDVI